MHLDAFTILVAGCTTLILQGALLVFSWLRDRQSPWLLWWGVPFIIGGAAITFYVQPGWESDFNAIAYGNASRIVSIGCLWQGLRLFNGRRVSLWPLAVAGLGWIGLCLVPGVISSMVLRVMLVSILNGVMCFAAASELMPSRSEDLPSRRPLMLVFLSFALVMNLRVVITPFAPFPMGAAPPDAIWVAGFVLIVFIHTAFAALLFFSLTRERREARQRALALSDPLTGLMNRRAFTDFAEYAARERTTGTGAMALLVLDLDHFKLVNDRHGHDAGDRLLQLFAAVAEANVRPADRLFRMGGEEFCFVLPNAAAAEAGAIAEGIRFGFEMTAVETSHGRARTTVSIGIAVVPQAIPVEVLLAAADAAVYEAKARGRNRVVFAEPGTLAGAARSGSELLRRRA